MIKRRNDEEEAFLDSLPVDRVAIVAAAGTAAIVPSLSRPRLPATFDLTDRSLPSHSSTSSEDETKKNALLESLLLCHRRTAVTSVRTLHAGWRKSHICTPPGQLIPDSVVVSTYDSRPRGYRFESRPPPSWFFRSTFFSFFKWGDFDSSKSKSVWAKRYLFAKNKHRFKRYLWPIKTS